MPNLALVEARDVYDRRRAEIERYLDFVKSILEKTNCCLVSGDVLEKVAASENTEDAHAALALDVPLSIDRSLTKTLLANSYLLVYNLVEATVVNAVDAIQQMT